VFEIGSSLREARTRRGLGLADIERATHIRSRYLAALEEDRFDALPGPAYAKGFLRTYADFLGLESQRFVDEYNARFAPTDEPAAPPPVRIKRRGAAWNPFLVGVPIAGLLIGLIAWQLTRSGGSKHPALPPPPERTAAAPRQPSPPAKQVAPVARVALVASRGPCWLEVHIGSPTSPSIYLRTLDQGRTARFVSKRIWIRIGAPWNLDATLNGRRLALPSTTASVIVTARGLRTI
jgi:cytoskeleton protein RodZ